MDSKNFLPRVVVTSLGSGDERTTFVLEVFALDSSGKIRLRFSS